MPVKAILGIDPSSLHGWYQRRDGDENISFFVEENGRSVFYRVKTDYVMVFDPVTRKEYGIDEWRNLPSVVVTNPIIDLKPVADYPIRATRCIYEGMIEITEATAGLWLDLGKVRDWATVYVNGRKVADLWCEPYACDIAPHVKPGRNAAIRVEVTSTWYNALVEDAKLPEKDRRTWTLFGPKTDAKDHDAGILGPVQLMNSCGNGPRKVK